MKVQFQLTGSLGHSTPVPVLWYTAFISEVFWKRISHCLGLIAGVMVWEEMTSALQSCPTIHIIQIDNVVIPFNFSGKTCHAEV